MFRERSVRERDELFLRPRFLQADSPVGYTVHQLSSHDSGSVWSSFMMECDTSVTERLDYADPTRINGKKTKIPVSTNYLKYGQIWEDRPIKREYSVRQFCSDYPSQGLNTGSNPVGTTTLLFFRFLLPGLRNMRMFLKPLLAPGV